MLHSPKYTVCPSVTCAIFTKLTIRIVRNTIIFLFCYYINQIHLSNIVTQYLCSSSNPWSILHSNLKQMWKFDYLWFAVCSLDSGEVSLNSMLLYNSHSADETLSSPWTWRPCDLRGSLITTPLIGFCCYIYDKIDSNLKMGRPRHETSCSFLMT